MTDILMQLMTDYGLIILSISILLGCMALPLPSSVLLVLCGAFAGSGDLVLTQVYGVALLSAIIGDQLAFGLGTLGGNALEQRLASASKYAKPIAKAKAFSAKWGGVGVFLSRWLVAPVGPWVNYASGIGDYPWRFFTLWAILGEIVWVGLYVLLGFWFSDNALALTDLLADASWGILGAILMYFMGKRLLKSLRKPVKGAQ